MAGRFLDFMAQGADADLPVAATMAAKIVPGSAAIYYANDSQKWYFYNEDTVAWDPLDLTVLTGLLSDLGDVDFSVAPTDGQMLAYDFASSKWKPMDVPAGYDDSMADARIAAASIGDLADVDLTGVADGNILIWDTDHFEVQPVPAGYSDEQARDAIGAALVEGVGIDITVNDGGDTITIASTITQYTDEMARDALGTALTQGSGVTITPNDGSDTITIAADPEFIRDTIGTALVEGSGIDITVNDGGDTITIAATGGTAGVLWVVTAVGTGASQGITIPSTVGVDADVLVFVNGLRWPDTEYSISGTTLTITTNASGDSVELLAIAVGGVVSVGINALTDVDTTTVAPATGDLLRWNGTNWVPAKGGKVFLGSQTASSSATLDFASLITSTYDEYEFEFVGLVPATNSVNLLCLMSTNNGSSYDSGANYGYCTFGANRFGTGFGGADSGATSIRLNQSAIANTSTKGISGTIKLFLPASTALHKSIEGLLSYQNTSTPESGHFHGQYQSTTAVDAIRFLMSSGNIASGTIRMYGIVK